MTSDEDRIRGIVASSPWLMRVLATAASADQAGASRDGRPEVLADEQGRKILPSVVGLTEAGELLVGEEARNQFLLYPERTVRSIKRRMGRAETVRMADREYTQQVRYRLVPHMW